MPVRQIESVKDSVPKTFPHNTVIFIADWFRN